MGKARLMAGMYGREWMDNLMRGKQPQSASLDADGILRFDSPPEAIVQSAASIKDCYIYLLDGLPHVLAAAPRLPVLLWWRYLSLRGELPREDMVDATAYCDDGRPRD